MLGKSKRSREGAGNALVRYIRDRPPLCTPVTTTSASTTKYIPKLHLHLHLLRHRAPPPLETGCFRPTLPLSRLRIAVAFRTRTVQYIRTLIFGSIWLLAFAGLCTSHPMLPSFVFSRDSSYCTCSILPLLSLVRDRVSLPSPPAR